MVGPESAPLRIMTSLPMRSSSAVVMPERAAAFMASSMRRTTRPAARMAASSSGVEMDTTSAHSSAPGRGFLEHGGAQQGIQSSLIAFAVFAQPGDDVGVETDGELLFHRAVEGGGNGVLPELFGGFGDIGEVDLAVGTSGKGGERTLAAGRQPAIIQSFRNDF